MQSFINYVFAVYGPGQEQGHVFGNALTLEEVTGAAYEHKNRPGTDFAGDSFDREAVRDIMLANRAKGKTLAEQRKAAMEAFGAVFVTVK